MYQTFGSTTSAADKTFLFRGVVTDSSSNPAIQTYSWTQPDGITMIYAVLVGGGAGGGGGGASAAATAGAGGEGGGSGAVSTLLIPAFLLPKTLYIICGSGGMGGTGQVQGGAAATAGRNGNITKLSWSQYTSGGTSGCIILNSGSAAATGGAAASGATAGTSAGIAETVFAPSTIPYVGKMGVMQFFAGSAGTNGGAAGAGVNFNFQTTATNAFCCSGTGGGGTNAGTTTAAGGIIQAFPSTPLPSDIAGGIAGGGNGNSIDYISSGLSSLMKPYYTLISSGGTGGGSNTSVGTGGRGGNGGPGSGGGGGGGTNGTASVGGAGGNGGPGFVIISCW